MKRLAALASIAAFFAATEAHAATPWLEGVTDETGYFGFFHDEPPLASNRYRLLVKTDRPMDAAGFDRSEIVEYYQWVDWPDDDDPLLWAYDGVRDYITSCGGSPSLITCLPSAPTHWDPGPHTFLGFMDPATFYVEVEPLAALERQFVPGVDDQRYRGPGRTELTVLAQPGTKVRVYLTAIPEPQAWTLMILGFGGVGAAMRHRTTRAQARDYLPVSTRVPRQSGQLGT